MTETLLQKITAQYRKKSVPDFVVGDQVVVSVKIIEGEKERIQNFEGIVIAYRQKNNVSANFTVRKIASGVGVERTFAIHSPHVEQIVVKRHGKVRRAKLFYLRDLSAKEARIKRDEAREWKTTSGEHVTKKVAKAEKIEAPVAPKALDDKPAKKEKKKKSAKK